MLSVNMIGCNAERANSDKDILINMKLITWTNPNSTNW